MAEIDVSILSKDVAGGKVVETSTPLTGDWWETLFQPRYGILDFEVPQDSFNDEECDEKNVYKRVWNQEQVKRVYQPRPNFELEHAEIKELADRLSNIREATTQTDECIWNTKEIGLMRNCVREVKAENMKLRALVLEQSQRLEEIDRKCRSQSKELTKKRSALSDAVKANDRFHILTEALSDHTRRGGALCSHLEDQLIARQEEIAGMRRDLEATGQNAVRLKQDNKKLKSRMDQLIKDFERKRDLAVDSALLAQKDEMEALRTKGDQLNRELIREREKHAAVSRGCKQLLKHYSREQPVAAVDIKNDIVLADMHIL